MVVTTLKHNLYQMKKQTIFSQKLVKENPKFHLTAPIRTVLLKMLLNNADCDSKILVHVSLWTLWVLSDKLTTWYLQLADQSRQIWKPIWKLKSSNGSSRCFCWIPWHQKWLFYLFSVHSWLLKTCLSLIYNVRYSSLNWLRVTALFKAHCIIIATLHLRISLRTEIL
jgi:hypothetical protein